MIEFEFTGLDELIREVESKLSDDAVAKIDKAIVQSSAKKARDNVSKKIRKSKNPQLSGRKGSRTGQHAADNVPVGTVKKKKGGYQAVVGWELSDNSPYFYTKFLEWGTSKIQAEPIFLKESQQIHRHIEKETLDAYTKKLKEVFR